jgi:phospholipid/cholesterol/gamma-HCH transport system substrate-binding protein
VILTRFVRIQLTVFSVLTVVALAVMSLHYMRLPELAGVGQHEITIELPTSGGLYGTANVTYRGATIGTVTDVVPTASGAEATLRIDSTAKIPVGTRAEVHSRSAIGEQYVDLVPDTVDGPFLQDGAAIPTDRTSVPQDIAPMFDTVNRGLEAIPEDKLEALIDESYEAFNGTGEDIQRLLESSSAVAASAADTADPTARLIQDAAPFLRSQVESGPALREWVHNLRDLSAQAAGRDAQLRSIFATAPTASTELTELFRRLRPTTPILLANLTSLGQVAVTYNRSLEQALVLVPPMVSMLRTITLPNEDTIGAALLDFNLNVNTSPPCTTGFLPASERRDGSAVDSPTRTSDAIYCAVPRDADVAARGARNMPCMDKPGKRAPTVEICKSDEEYVPKGTNPWVGNPTPTSDNPLAAEGNAAFDTIGVPGPSPVGTANYNPATGEYQGSDGQTYRQPDLAQPNVVPTLEDLLTRGR